MKKYLLYSLACCLLATTAVSAQKVLQIEKRNSTKTKKYYLGSDITFQLHSEPEEWQTETLQDIDAQNNTLQLGYRTIALADIAAIKERSRHARWAQPISKQLYIFATTWTALSIADALVSNQPVFRLSLAVVAIPALALGFILDRSFRHRTYHIGQKRRLRLLNLNMLRGIGP